VSGATLQSFGGKVAGLAFSTAGFDALANTRPAVIDRDLAGP
jgi:hypothetical protein